MVNRFNLSAFIILSYSQCFTWSRKKERKKVFHSFFSVWETLGREEYMILNSILLTGRVKWLNSTSVRFAFPRQSFFHVLFSTPSFTDFFSPVSLLFLFFLSFFLSFFLPWSSETLGVWENDKSWNVEAVHHLFLLSCEDEGLMKNF